MGSSISSLRNSMARVPLDVDSVYERAPLDGYANLIGMLLALVGLKYQVLNINPFNEHPALMVLFLISTIVYVMALLVLRSNGQINSAMIWWVCFICGILACQLLLLLLVSRTWAFVINLSPLLLLLIFFFSYQYFFQPSQSEETSAPTMPNP